MGIILNIYQQKNIIFLKLHKNQTKAKKQKPTKDTEKKLFSLLKDVKFLRNLISFAQKVFKLIFFKCKIKIQTKF